MAVLGWRFSLIQTAWRESHLAGLPCYFRLFVLGSAQMLWKTVLTVLMCWTFVPPVVWISFDRLMRHLSHTAREPRQYRSRA